MTTSLRLTTLRYLLLIATLALPASVLAQSAGEDAEGALGTSDEEVVVIEQDDA